jgi:CHAT domain-containing protein
LAELGREAERLEERLNVALDRLVPGLRRDLTEVTAEGVRARLRPGSALAEFTRGRVFDFKATGKMRHWHPAHYYAFVVTPAPGGATRMLDLGEAAPIDQAIERLRAKVIAFKDDWKAQKFAGDDPLKNETDEEASYREAAADLYKLLLAPVRKELGAAQTLYVSPDSQLNLLPFEALVDADGKYLIESYDLSYVSSGRELLAAPAEVARGTAVFAAPDYNMTAAARAQKLKGSPAATPAPAAAPAEVARAQTRGGTWVELKGSAAEAADVKKSLEGTAYGGVTSYLAQDALEERLKRVRSPRLLHVSTHGFFPPESREQEPAELDLATGNVALVGQSMLRQAGDPLLESGLVLAGANRLGEAGRPEGLDDGWVTAEEITQMDLRGTELVVLSACGTGLGAVSSGEGIYGLRRAFQLAGARGVVSTLFEVPDEDSARLMRDFYEGLKQQKPKSVALTYARLKLINERRKAGKSAHPFFWSGFVLTGGQN